MVRLEFKLTYILKSKKVGNGCVGMMTLKVKTYE